MKNYILILTIAFSLFSCQKDEQYEDYNRDPKNPTAVASDFLFTNAIASMGDQMASANVNTNIFRFISQYWTATTYFDEPNYNIRRRTIPQNQWSEIYRDVILDIQNAKEIVSANEQLSDSELQARLGQLEVMEVYAWEIMVDTFGDIPYSEALNATEFATPKYDNASSIYENLINRLLAVSDQFAGQGFSSADIIYQGDMTKWSKFANSLLLRMGIMISDSNVELSQQAVEAAVDGGVFISNDDSALLQYQSSTPNTNPLWVDLVQSGRSDYVVANTIVDYMNDLNDPRRPFYFNNNIDGNYIGGIYGAESNGYGNFTHVGNPFLDPTHPGILLDYAEVEFNLAEAADLGYDVAGNAEEHYTAGITASIAYWGGSEEEITSYLAQEDVAYNGSNDQFATQFWIAMYDNAFQGWNVWRKFDAPELNIAAQSKLPIPLRYTYPTNEETLNATNKEAASKAIGGDEQQTRLFWDIN